MIIPQNKWKAPSINSKIIASEILQPTNTCIALEINLPKNTPPKLTTRIIKCPRDAMNKPINEEVLNPKGENTP